MQVDTSNEEFMEVSSEKTPIIASHCRQAYTQSEFKKKYHYYESHQKGFLESMSVAVRNDCSDSPTSCAFWWRFTTRIFPIFNWMRYYNVKQNLVADIIAGLTIGVMHIPQGMAYAMLANVPPVMGLYVSLFPVIIYVFMGTSRHISIGTFAVLCLMLSKAVDSLATSETDTLRIDDINNESLVNDDPQTISLLEDQVKYSSIEVATVVCFVVGIMQILMAFLHLGSLSVYLSDTLVSGFTTGAAFHVLTSQVKNLFGISVGAHNGFFKLIYVYIDIFSAIHKSNHIAVIISVVTVLILFLVSEFVNPRIKPRLKIPLPMELFAIVLGTFLSYNLELSPKYNVKVVGYIPVGLPSPKKPPFELIPKVLGDSVAIAIVGFTIALSMAKLFSKKHRYDVDANQELFSLGMANAVSSFFTCFPCSASLSRSLIQEAAGGKTQVAGIVSCAFLILIILLVGPVFEELPNCILSSIIVVALIGMFRQMKEVKTLWRISKIECGVWIITFAGVVLNDVDIGLAIGLIASVLSVMLRTQKPYACLMGQVHGTDIYMDISKYKTAQEEDNIKIFRFCSSLYYANREFFRSELYRLVGINPQQHKMKMSLGHKSNSSKHKNNEHESIITESSIATTFTSELPESIDTISSSDDSDKEHRRSAKTILPPEYVDDILISLEVCHIIIDCSLWSFIDTVGIATLLQMIEDYAAMNISVYLACCSDTVVSTLEKYPCFNEKLKNVLFPTIGDALAIILFKSNRKSNVCTK